MIRNADKHRKALSFSKGNLVFVKLQPYKQISVKGQRYLKLSKRYFGPINKLGPVAYKLQLTTTSRVHPLFHVSLLKKHYGDPHSQTPELSSESVDNGPVIQPAAILDSKQLQNDSTTHSLVFVQWDGLPVEDTSWEDLSEL